MDVDIARLIREGLNLGGAGFLLVHNHPSGNARPSRGDLDVTRYLTRVATDGGMPLVDHLIVARGDVWSFNSFSEFTQESFQLAIGLDGDKVRGVETSTILLNQSQL